jgi:hypothetical protein
MAKKMAWDTTMVHVAARGLSSWRFVRQQRSRLDSKGWKFQQEFWYVASRSLMTFSHEFLAYFLNMLSTRVASWKMICGGHFSVPHPSIFIKNHCLLLQILEKLMSGALINPHQERQQVETLAENPQPLPYHPLLRRRTNLRLHRPPLHHHGISSHLIWLLIYIYCK